MTTAARANFVKVLPPRALTDKETTHSLTQWKINFKQYCKKDDLYRHFLLATTEWDATEANYGFTDNVGARTPAILGEEVQDFLYMLTSYMPHGYITDKVLKKSRSFESAFSIIEEHYGLVPSQETFCDLSDMSRLPGEPYRQFYDRMVAFVYKHLMQRNTTNATEVDGVQIPDNGDSMSVSMLNLIALQWISKIHPDMLTIVRTEYAKELRDNSPLSSLVPRLSLSVDALLAKYDKVPLVAKLDKMVHEQENNQEATIQRLSGNNKPNKKRNGAGFQQAFCPGCFYLGNRVKAKVNFKHTPDSCPRSSALVAMIAAEEDAGNDHQETEVCCNELIQAPRTTVTSSIRQVASLERIQPLDNILCNKDENTRFVLRLNARIQQS